MKIDPSFVAKDFRAQVRNTIQSDELSLKLVGFLANDDEASEVYSNFTRVGCEDVGVKYEALRVSRVELEGALRAANADDSVTGVIVYYPVFGGARDAHLRSVLSPLKDIEGLHPFWLDRLYDNVRRVNEVSSEAKPLLPCTPLAIFKLLEAAGEMQGSADKPSSGDKPFSGKKITVFNRSEVVGRPLAFMMANDGAKVFSFDENGTMLFSPDGGEEEFVISREEALSQSDIVITGVPSRKFEPIALKEISPNACCLNFSSIKNFADDVPEGVRTFIPRVGPVTVAMCLRNLLRLHQQYQNNPEL